MSFSAAETLIAARKAAGLTQSQLATRAGLSRMTVQKIEAGTIDPRLSTLLVLLRALGLEVALVPAPLKVMVEAFIRSGGRVIGQPAGTSAPPSIVDALSQRAQRAREAKKKR